MNAKQKRDLETQLLRMGLPGLTETGEPTGDLIGAIAQIVNHWTGAPNRYGEWIDRHYFLRDLLAECDIDKRTEMYDALVPRLNFKVKPLHHYEMLIAERVGRLVSQRKMRVEGDAPKPIEVGGNRYAAAPAAIATHAVASLTCHRCKKFEKFLADTPVGAMIEARKAGWTREKGINKETCPDCSVAVAETLVRLSNDEVMPIYDRRACKLDA